MSHHINLVRIKGVYNALEELNETVAFVGGATVSLYVDRPEQADVRPTNDIDVLIEIGSYGEYVRIQEKLAAIGFNVDPEAKVTCRYKYQGLTVDVMPTDEDVLGFSNKWYKEGFSNLIAYQIDERTAVNIFSPAYFIASKLEAYKGRGNNDGRTSQDFEDIVFVLDNRKTIWLELNDSRQVESHRKPKGARPAQIAKAKAAAKEVKKATKKLNAAVKLNEAARSAAGNAAGEVLYRVIELPHGTPAFTPQQPARDNVRVRHDTPRFAQ